LWWTHRAPFPEAWPEGWQLVLFYMHLIFMCACNYYLLVGPFDCLFNYLDWNILCNKEYCYIKWCVKLLPIKLILFILYLHLCSNIWWNSENCARTQIYGFAGVLPPNRSRKWNLTNEYTVLRFAFAGSARTELVSALICVLMCPLYAFSGPRFKGIH
jgi:hypothetical protein